MYNVHCTMYNVGAYYRYLQNTDIALNITFIRKYTLESTL